MRFKATDVYNYYKPSPCARRVALRARGEPEQDTDTPFIELLRRLGNRHEKGHLATLSGVLDLSTSAQLERERLTVEAIRAGTAAAIYQPRFRAAFALDGQLMELIGEPDFLIQDVEHRGYVIRDSKLARGPLSDRHEGIALQLQIYGLLYERSSGRPPAGLEVHAGTGEIVSLPYQGESVVRAVLREHIRMRGLDPESYEPVGWSKCSGCGYHDRCWADAEARSDVALLPTVQQRRARELHARGVKSIGAISSALDDPEHRDYFWSGKASPALPAARNLDELDRVYLWGLKVRGNSPSPYLSAQVGFGPDADRTGWLAFLRMADSLLAQYGAALSFVHWSHHEGTKMDQYVERYGDPAGTAGRVRANLVDLLSVLKASVALPVPSYSLKVVDAYVGFHRRLSEASGAWSIAKYIEATEATDPAARDAIVGEILAYNEEDLDATWAVFEWLREHAARGSDGVI